MNFVDTHAHVFNKQGPFIETARYTPKYNASKDNFIQHLDSHGIKYGVLIQPSFYGTDNSYMLEAVAQSNGRLKAVIVVPNNISFTELQRYHKQGARGIRLNLFGIPVPNVMTEEWKTLFQHLSTLGWHLELHCPPSYLIQLLPALANYNIDVVIDHLGRIPTDQSVNSEEYQQFLALLNPTQHWLKLSGLYRIAKEDEIVEKATLIYTQLKSKGFLSRIVWGSDWPHTQHEQETDYDKNWDLFLKVVPDEQERVQILTNNAYRLFGFDAK